MTQTTDGAKRVVEDATLLLRTVRDERAAERRPWQADIRRLVEGGLAVDFGELVKFLERYGYVAIERKTDILDLTQAGRQVVDAAGERRRALEADARYHFAERLGALGADGRSGRIPTRFDGRWLKEAPIGAGALGSVWRGRLLSVDRPVALKVMSGLNEIFTGEQRDEVLRRLDLAVRAQARLVNPFVIQVLDQNIGYETPYFVMELATGGSLRALLEGGPLPPPVAVRYFVQIAIGLRAAHQAGLVHRDLKPENVLLDGTGNVKLTDFGLTRIVERDGVKLKQAYVGYGSVGYMAPECFRRGADVGPAADLYALGILLYELLVGELPGRRSPMPSQVVSGVPSDLDDLFDALTQDDAARRPDGIDRVLTRIWTSQAVVALLDARQAPYFSDSPVSLPGLPDVELDEERAAPVTASAPDTAPRAATAEPAAPPPAPPPAPSTAPRAALATPPATAIHTTPASDPPVAKALEASVPPAVAPAVDAASAAPAAAAVATLEPQWSAASDTKPTPETPARSAAPAASEPGNSAASSSTSTGLLRPRAVPSAKPATPRASARAPETLDRSVGPEIPAVSMMSDLRRTGLEEPDDSLVDEATSERFGARADETDRALAAAQALDDGLEDADVLIDDGEDSIEEALASGELNELSDADGDSSVRTAVVDLRKGNAARESSTLSEPPSRRRGAAED
jgi:serine/threonine protein kinase